MRALSKVPAVDLATFHEDAVSGSRRAPRRYTGPASVDHFDYMPQILKGLSHHRFKRRHYETLALRPSRIQTGTAIRASSPSNFSASLTSLACVTRRRAACSTRSIIG